MSIKNELVHQEYKRGFQDCKSLMLEIFDDNVNDKNGFRKAFTIGQVREALENFDK